MSTAWGSENTFGRLSVLMMEDTVLAPQNRSSLLRWSTRVYRDTLTSKSKLSVTST